MNSIIEAITCFKNKKILVIGDVILDHFTFGKINRINPEQPAAPLMDVLEDQFVLGGASNVANNLSSLGTHVTLVGLIGKDKNSVLFQKECSKNKINFIPILDNRQTIVKQRFIAHGQQITRVDREEKHPISKEKEILAISKLLPAIEESDCVVFSEYCKGFLTKNLVTTVITHAKKNNKPVYSAIKPKSAHFFKQSDLVCCNHKEAEEITGLKFKDELFLIEKSAKRIMDLLSPGCVVITLSDKGMYIYDSKGVKEIIPTRARQVIDVTGAGDTVISLLAVSNLDLDISASAKIANLGAGLVVEKVGTSKLVPDELIQSLKHSTI